MQELFQSTTGQYTKNRYNKLENYQEQTIRIEKGKWTYLDGERQPAQPARFQQQSAPPSETSQPVETGNNCSLFWRYIHRALQQRRPKMELNFSPQASELNLDQQLWRILGKGSIEETYLLQFSSAISFTFCTHSKLSGSLKISTDMRRCFVLVFLSLSSCFSFSLSVDLSLSLLAATAARQHSLAGAVTHHLSSLSVRVCV
ncbi:hypothetical protein PIB30_019537 [Stylosanthes scabra]|uniref:Uncharacterized protein n=1 Tax=Stylosanthes scabra TaxID=79078 RepID=A0ABU6W6J2_9FABA|nr:hypothetical protein [Stylosanthes scabra]